MDLSFLYLSEKITKPHKLIQLLLHARFCTIIISFYLFHAWSRIARALHCCLISFSEANNSAIISIQHLRGNKFTRKQSVGHFRFGREEAKVHRMACSPGGQVRAPAGLAGCGKNWGALGAIKPGSRLSVPTDMGKYGTWAPFTLIFYNTGIVTAPSSVRL